MCAVSTVGDYWANTIPQRYPNYPYPFEYQPYPNPVPIAPYPGGGIPLNPGGGTGYPPTIQTWATPADIQALRNDILELRKLLLAALEFDKKTGQQDCHMDEKVELIKAFAKMVGVDMNDIFPESK